MENCLKWIPNKGYDEFQKKPTKISNLWGNLYLGKGTIRKKKPKGLGSGILKEISIKRKRNENSRWNLWMNFRRNLKKNSYKNLRILRKKKSRPILKKITGVFPYGFIRGIFEKKSHEGLLWKSLSNRKNYRKISGGNLDRTPEYFYGILKKKQKKNFQRILWMSFLKNCVYRIIEL